jgi:hypothetical protein
MNTSNKMLKYYIGIIVLFMFTIGLVVYTASTGADAKQDKKTADKMQEIASKIDSEITQSGEVPASLTVLKVKDVPSTITYTKVDASSYKVCVTYATAGNGFDAGWTSLVGGALASRGYSGTDSTQQHDYLDTTTLVYAHKKGQTCQTVKPYGLGSSGYNYNSNSDNLTSTSNDYGAAQSNPAKCTGLGSFSQIETGKITAVDAAGSTVQLTVTKTNKASSVEYDTITKAYDTDCKEIAITSLKVGDTVKYYGYVGSALVDVIELQ